MGTVAFADEIDEIEKIYASDTSPEPDEEEGLDEEGEGEVIPDDLEHP